MSITAKQIGEFRAKTGLPMMECKKALEEAGGDEAKAIEILKKRGLAKVEKRAERETNAGIVEAYVHANNQIGTLVEVQTETDFVARNEEFKEFVHDVALHITAMAPKYISSAQVPAEEVEKQKEYFQAEMNDSGKPAEIIDKIIEGKLNKYYAEVCLLNQPFVKEQDKTIGELLTEKVAKIGEKIEITRFARFAIGE